MVALRQAVLIALPSLLSIIQANTQVDYFCGTSYSHAKNECTLPCTSGFDFECTSQLGNDWKCYYFTGCAAKLSGETDTKVPTFKPTDNVGTDAPSMMPSLEPSGYPTLMPTDAPSPKPSVVPTNRPTNEPSVAPINSPTAQPSSSAAAVDSLSPSRAPVQSPQIQTDGNINTTITLTVEMHNTRKRKLTQEEQDTFQKGLMIYLKMENVTIHQVEIIDQQLITWQAGHTGKRVRRTSEVKSTAFTIQFKLSHNGFYSELEVTEVLVGLVQENELNILNMIKIYPFFDQVDEMRVGGVDERGDGVDLKESIDVEEALSKDAVVVEDGSKSKAGMIAGISIAVLLLISAQAGCGLYIFFNRVHHNTSSTTSQRTLDEDVSDLESGITKSQIQLKGKKAIRNHDALKKLESREKKRHVQSSMKQSIKTSSLNSLENYSESNRMYGSGNDNEESFISSDDESYSSSSDDECLLVYDEDDSVDLSMSKKNKSKGNVASSDDSSSASELKDSQDQGRVDVDRAITSIISKNQSKAHVSIDDGISSEEEGSKNERVRAKVNKRIEERKTKCSPKKRSSSMNEGSDEQNSSTKDNASSGNSMPFCRHQLPRDVSSMAVMGGRSNIIGVLGMPTSIGASTADVSGMDIQIEAHCSEIEPSNDSTTKQPKSRNSGSRSMKHSIKSESTASNSLSQSESDRARAPVKDQSTEKQDELKISNVHLRSFHRRLSTRALMGGLCDAVEPQAAPSNVSGMNIEVNEGSFCSEMEPEGIQNKRRKSRDNDGSKDILSKSMQASSSTKHSKSAEHTKSRSLSLSESDGITATDTAKRHNSATDLRKDSFAQSMVVSSSRGGDVRQQRKRSNSMQPAQNESVEGMTRSSKASADLRSSHKQSLTRKSSLESDSDTQVGRRKKHRDSSKQKKSKKNGEGLRGSSTSRRSHSSQKRRGSDDGDSKYERRSSN